MAFRILGLDPSPFMPLYGLPSDELARRGVRRLVVDASPGFPDRVEVRDAAPGETVLLLNHVHQPADTPYRASHAIFVREYAGRRYDGIDTVPDALRRRVLSLRAFDAHGDMVDADLVEGPGIEGLIGRLLGNRSVAYVHAHYAKPGCYAARIERA
ncbi:DUF1203 domain-containing protein [Luteibacter sp. PPL552]